MKLATVKADLCGVWVDIEVRFSTSNFPIPRILGREGVFDRLFIGFAHEHGGCSLLASNVCWAAWWSAIPYGR